MRNALAILMLSGLAAFSQNTTNSYTGQETKTNDQRSNVASGGAASSPIITAVTGGSTLSGFTFDGGFQFTVSGSYTITDLGRFALSGNSLSHTIYIRDSSCNVLASKAVSMSGVTAGTAAYGSITPLVLSAGTYYCLCSELTGGDSYLSDNCTITSSGAVTITSSAYRNTTCSLQTAGVKAFGVATFKGHP